MAINVVCYVKTCETSSVETIEVRSHPDDDNLVIVEIGEQRCAVNGEDLIQAVKNAMHTNIYFGL